ncbi:DNA glycosylase [Xylariaceae sp. FL0255]|nr:DNA glycosylase [Xylariaceae sp. FL0255]
MLRNIALATKSPCTSPLQPPLFISSTLNSNIHFATFRSSALTIPASPKSNPVTGIRHFNSISASIHPRRRSFAIHIYPQLNQTANMSTRRSARLSAASDLKEASSSSPAAMPPPPKPKGRKRKAEANEDAPEPAPTPTTPNKRRVQKKSTPPPATPTPSNAKLLGEPAAVTGNPTTTASKKPIPSAVSRLADPNTTLATLLSPETSRVVTSTKAIAAARSQSASPTKKSVVPVSTSASSNDKQTSATGGGANILEEANRHLISVDERMRPLVENNHCRVFSPEGLAEQIDPFEALCSGIISQQVSGAAAKAIKKRFIDLFQDEEGYKADDEMPEGATTTAENKEEGGENKRARFPHPSQVVAMSLETLRTAGLSQRKAEYVSGLAEKFVSSELSAQLLADAPYDEVITRLTAVRGLGQWSAEMFAFFALKRMDVFSLGDLGIQRGMAAFVGRDVAKLKSKGGKWKYMSAEDMTELSDKFKPYRSLFMWYMWRVEETDVSTME